MNPTLKKILIIAGIILSWAAIVAAFYIYNSHQEAEFQKQLQEQSEANRNLELNLADMSKELEYLQQKQNKTVELVESTSTVINELQNSVTSAGSTIKEIREQQAKIKAAVIALIDDYNRIVESLKEDGATDE